MKCDNMRELIPFLDDGTLEPETVKSVRIHMEGCPACRKEYEVVNDMLNRIHETLLENESLPVPEFLEMIREKIEKKKKIRALSYRVFSAAAVIIFTVSVTLYNFMNRETTVPVSEQYVMEESLDEYDEYIASQYLTADELYELVEADESDNSVLLEALINYHYNSITPEDIIDNMNEEELKILFAN